MKKIKTQTEKISGRFGITLATVAMLLVVFAGKAQEVYHPITDGCIWSVSNEKYMTVGDTVLDGKTYLKIYRQVGDQPFEFSLEDAEYFAAIRNDSVGKKVYAYLPAGTWVYDQFNQLTIIDTGMEVLLYDFSIQLEDSFCYYTIRPTFHAAQEIFAYRSESAYVVEGYENGQSLYTVYENSDSLITISDGSTRRRILLEITWGVDYWNDVWIEGIGRLNGFNDQAGFETDVPLKMLLCYSDNNGATYQTGYDFDGSDDCFNYGHGGGDVPEREMLKVKIYPNPTDDVLFIELSGGAEISNIALYDLQGRVVGANNHSPLQGMATTLDVKSVPAGIYILRVTDTEGKEYHRKIVRK